MTEKSDRRELRKALRPLHPYVEGDLTRIRAENAELRKRCGELVAAGDAMERACKGLRSQLVSCPPDCIGHEPDNMDPNNPSQGWYYRDEAVDRLSRVTAAWTAAKGGCDGDVPKDS